MSSALAKNDQRALQGVTRPAVWVSLAGRRIGCTILIAR